MGGLGKSQLDAGQYIACASFETPASQAPQDDGVPCTKNNRHGEEAQRRLEPRMQLMQL
jgi:hypothetical protein